MFLLQNRGGVIPFIHKPDLYSRNKGQVLMISDFGSEGNKFHTVIQAGSCAH